MTSILVIEDEDPIRSNIVEMLELESFDILEAADGKQGVALATEHQPDLILCDITMPGLDGYDVLVRLRENPPTAMIPFIFLTARSDRAFMRHGMELGADDYLTKPFTLTELRTAIRSRLARYAHVKAESEQQMEQARQLLVQLVSHELRTPLVAINTATEIISRQIGHISDDQLRDLVETISRGGKRLGRLVEQMILLTQIESGMLSRDYIREYGVVARLSDLMIGALDLARSFAYRQPDVTVRIDERDRDAAVLTETRALKHALAELVTNAISFSDPGSEVLVFQWQAEGSVWLSVVDHGPGIPPDKLKRALNRFEQVDRAQREQQGIGLGLPLARHIIETYGGIFEISSVVDKGTQVTISLPLVPADEVAAPSGAGV